jgi:GntR family transcriptional repressor for pyruvate dehydrogenase complex
MHDAYNNIDRFARDDLAEKVSAELRNRIINNDIKPGSVLPTESQLTGMFAVSRTVVREAMRKLQAQGMVELSQGRRTRVSEPHPKAVIDTLYAFLRRTKGTIDHYYEARYVIEGEIAALATERARPEDIAGLGKILSDINDTGDIDEIIRLDMEFHLMLAKITGNPILIVFLESISAIIHKAQELAYEKLGTGSAYIEHYKIFEHIKNGNAKEAREAMLAHILFRFLNKAGAAQ